MGARQGLGKSPVGATLLMPADGLPLPAIRIEATMADNVYIVLFRGVGGATKLPVKELQAALTDAGFREVRTYIASGNAVLASDLPASKVQAQVAAVASKTLGFDKAVFVRTRRDWAAIIRGNPFRQAVAKPKTVHAFLIETKPTQAALSALKARIGDGPEEFAIRGKALYLHTPDGFGPSKVPPAVEKALSRMTTARNWNTVLRLGEIAAEVAAACASPPERPSVKVVKPVSR